MTERLFSVGDTVRVRPFGEIDTSDIGTIEYTPTYCYGISRTTVNSYAKDGLEYKIRRFSEYKGAYIYGLTTEDGNDSGWSWAQGMLAPVYKGELPEVDPGSLFELFGDVVTLPPPSKEPPKRKRAPKKKPAPAVTDPLPF